MFKKTFKKSGLLLFALTLLFATSAVSADKATEANKVNGSKTTIIKLTKEEAQLFEEINGGKANDASIAGGEIVYAGNLDEKEKAEYKKNLLNPKNSDVKVVAVDKEKDVNALWCTGYYLTNIQTAGNGGWYFNNQRLTFAQATYPVQISVSVATSVQATWSANVGVSNGVVEAGIGYSLSTQTQLQTTGTWTPPAGKSGRLEAYALYNKKTWDVWLDDCGGPTDTYAGKGEVYIPNGGVYFKQVIL